MRQAIVIGLVCVLCAVGAPAWAGYGANVATTGTGKVDYAPAQAGSAKASQAAGAYTLDIATTSTSGGAFAVPFSVPAGLVLTGCTFSSDHTCGSSGSVSCLDARGVDQLLGAGAGIIVSGAGGAILMGQAGAVTTAGSNQTISTGVKAVPFLVITGGVLTHTGSGMGSSKALVTRYSFIRP